VATRKRERERERKGEGKGPGRRKREGGQGEIVSRRDGNKARTKRRSVFGFADCILISRADIGVGSFAIGGERR